MKIKCFKISVKSYNIQLFGTKTNRFPNKQAFKENRVFLSRLFQSKEVTLQNTIKINPMNGVAT
jgi:hypothetical protein